MNYMLMFEGITAMKTKNWELVRINWKSEVKYRSGGLL